MRRTSLLLLLGASLLIAAPALANARKPAVSLRETVAVTPFRDLAEAREFRIEGSADERTGKRVWLRVTDGIGKTVTAQVAIADGKFSAKYPNDFANAASLWPAVYFVDAAPAENAPAEERAEAAVLVYDSRTGRLPELPSAFTTDLRAADGSVDAAAP
ncbi:MAG TPA: hypothetical protein VEA63_08285, partial [Opitutus sp.]|nr:hypothetical protein [Opitutus sp.]